MKIFWLSPIPAPLWLWQSWTTPKFNPLPFSLWCWADGQILPIMIWCSKLVQRTSMCFRKGGKSRSMLQLAHSKQRHPDSAATPQATSDQISWVSSKNLLVLKNPMSCKNDGSLSALGRTCPWQDMRVSNSWSAWGESQIPPEALWHCLLEMEFYLCPAAFHFEEFYWLFALPAEPFAEKGCKSHVVIHQDLSFAGKGSHNVQLSFFMTPPNWLQ